MQNDPASHVQGVGSDTHPRKVGAKVEYNKGRGEKATKRLSRALTALLKLKNDTKP